MDNIPLEPKLPPSPSQVLLPETLVVVFAKADEAVDNLRDHKSRISTAPRQSLRRGLFRWKVDLNQNKIKEAVQKRQPFFFWLKLFKNQITPSASQIIPIRFNGFHISAHEFIHGVIRSRTDRFCSELNDPKSNPIQKRITFKIESTPKSNPLPNRIQFDF